MIIAHPGKEVWDVLLWAHVVLRHCSREPGNLDGPFVLEKDICTILSPAASEGSEEHGSHVQPPPGQRWDLLRGLLGEV